MKDILGVDFDETLVDFDETWKRYYLEVHGKTGPVDWHDPEQLRLGHAFIASEYHDYIEAVDGAIEGMRMIATIRTPVIITFRDEVFRSPTIQLMEKRFPATFKDVYFLNRDRQNILGTKADVCRKIGAREHIDDSIRVVIETHAAGIRSFLFDTPHNRQEDVPNVPRVNWRSFVDHLR